MHGLGSRDGDNLIDWGKTSEDYSVHRPGPPLASLLGWQRGNWKRLLLDCADAGFLPHFYARLGYQVVAAKMHLVSFRRRLRDGVDGEVACREPRR